MTRSVGIMDDLRLAIGDVLDRSEALGAAGARGGGHAPPHEAAALRVEAYVEAAATIMLLREAAKEPPTTHVARRRRLALLVSLRIDAQKVPAEFGACYCLDPTRGLVDPMIVIDLVEESLGRRGRL